jgi:hypothetical protein
MHARGGGGESCSGHSARHQTTIANLDHSILISPSLGGETDLPIQWLQQRHSGCSSVSNVEETMVMTTQVRVLMRVHHTAFCTIERFEHPDTTTRPGHRALTNRRFGGDRHIIA